MSKRYDELEFTDAFMFSKIMYAYPEYCKELLELILGIPIAKIEYPVYEKTIEMLPDAHGIRLDVYTSDEEGKIYDIEMQVRVDDDLAKRSRYYHSLIDLNLLERGKNYDNLNDVYVIFILRKRPAEKMDQPVYTFRYQSQEHSETFLNDGTFTIFLNADCDMTGLSPQMKSFLQFVRNGKADENGSELSTRLWKAVQEARKDRKWRTEYMTLEDYGDIRFEDGRKEEQKNTEAERKRADAAEDRADAAEKKLAETLAELERLKSANS